MNETAVFATVATGLWGITLALIATVWTQLTGRIGACEKAADALVTQNTGQETAIGRLIERMTARENAHAEHREEISNRLDRLESKIDQLLRGGGGGRGGTPYPTRYFGESGEGKKT